MARRRNAGNTRSPESDRAMPHLTRGACVLAGRGGAARSPAGKAGRHDVRAHEHLLVGQPVRDRRQVRHGVRHQKVVGLGAVDGVAEAPAAHGLEAVPLALAVLRVQAVEAGVGGSAGTDGTGDDPLAFGIALDISPELLDHAHGLVPNRQALGDGILALEDVDIRPADGRRRDPQERIVRPDVGYGLVVQDNAARLDEHGGFHHGGHG